jgi:hypothetical protein
MTVLSSSYAISASYAINADFLDGQNGSAFATTGSNIFIGNQTVTGSLFTNGSNTLVGSTTLTGSLNITGSTTQTGNNTLIGNTTLSGSIIISGSTGPGAATASVQIYGDIRQTGYHRFDPVTTNIDTSITASYIFVSGSTNDLYFSQNSAGYSNVTRLRWLEGNLYTGLLNGGLITAATGSTVYQVSSGSGIIVNLNASLNDNPYPTIQYLNWGNLSASIAPLTASYQQAFVSIDSSGNIYQQGTPYAAGQFDTEINIGVVLFQNGSTINGVKTQPTVAYGFEQQQNIFNRAFGPLKLSGYTLAPSGSSTGSLIVASGTAYSPGSNYPIDPNNPSYTTDSGTNVSKIFRYRQSGSTWVYDTNAGLGYGAIDPTQYSDNGVLTAVPGTGINREFSIQRVFYFPNSVAKAIVVYYGNATYASLVDATSNIAFESFVEAPNTAANAIYLGAIIVRNDANFTVTDSYAIQAGGLFRSVGGSGGGGSTITQTLSSLSDVLISGPTNGQALVYDTTAAKWRNLSSISASISGNAATATTASYAFTASFAQNAQTASYALTATSASYALNALSASYALNATTASHAVNTLSASYALTATTSSHAISALSASYALTATSASYAATASSADNFTVRGTLTAQTIVVQTITSSTDFVTGSTRFGSLLSNTHQFTGSVSITGSLTAIGNTNITGSLGVTSTVSASLIYQSPNTGNAFTSLASSGNTALVTISSTGATINMGRVGAIGLLANSTDGGIIMNDGAYLGVSSGTLRIGSNLAANNVVIGNFAGSTATINGNTTISGSLTVFTGSAVEFQVTNTGVKIGNIITDVHTVTGSLNISGSVTATNFTGSLFGTASWANNATTASYVLNAVSASFASTASTANNGFTIGITQTYTNTVASSVVGSNNVFTQTTGSYTSAFYKYTVSNGANARSGEVIAVWNGSSAQYTDYSTLDIGSTSGVTPSVSVVGSDILFNITTGTSGWRLKSTVTYL